MEIVLYFGSFNPIHIGHLIIANYVLNETNFHQLWLVVSPQNPLKKPKNLLNEYHRLHLCNLAVEDNPNLHISDIEFHLPKPSYTIHTMTYLNEKHPDCKFSILMGSDSFKNIRKWKNSEVLLYKYPIIIYKRQGHEIKNKYGARIKILEAPLLNISSTQIRTLITEKKSIKYLVQDKVLEEIDKGGYYKK